MTEATGKTNIREIKGIGEKKAQSFNKLGIFTIGDLLSFFPRRYEDRTNITEICDTSSGESFCIRAMVADTPRTAIPRRGLQLLKFKAVDDSGSVAITYFNQSYLKNVFKTGEWYNFYGSVEVSGSSRKMTNPVFEACSKPDKKNTERIVPLYRLVKGLNNGNIYDAVSCALTVFADSPTDILPEEIRRRNKLCSSLFAYENIHFPKDFASLEIAKRRLVFEELFILSAAFGLMRGKNEALDGIKISSSDISGFLAALPYTPTSAQLRVISEALDDMTSGKCMNRLVQGDVGSGKTLVAAALIYAVFKSGYSSAFMAPTEILADQHYSNLEKLLSPLGMRVLKLTGGMPAKEKRAVKAKLAGGEYDLVIGTHALISEDVTYSNLALIITDEQHRFGVNQRAELVGKGFERPHVLVMSATPIPRTLALIIYGDLELSVIDELPPGRQTIGTYLVDESYRERINNFIIKNVGSGHQVYVVCPAIDENEESELNLKTAVEHASALSASLAGITVGCMHGKLKAAEKDAIMSDFISGKIDVLVSTTVIEVGVDVPNATLMIIENAERFGLSQLHQLRGRVGRGSDKSHCILISDNKSDDVQNRLKVFTSTNDGFKISEEDLKNRGPGDFFGSRQHGLPETHIADLGTDVNVLKEAQEQAMLLLEEDPGLNLPANALLKQRINELFTINKDTFN